MPTRELRAGSPKIVREVSERRPDRPLVESSLLQQGSPQLRPEVKRAVVDVMTQGLWPRSARGLIQITRCRFRRALKPHRGSKVKREPVESRGSTRGVATI